MSNIFSFIPVAGRDKNHSKKWQDLPVSGNEVMPHTSFYFKVQRSLPTLVNVCVSTVQGDVSRHSQSSTVERAKAHCKPFEIENNKRQNNGSLDVFYRPGVLRFECSRTFKAALLHTKAHLVALRWFVKCTSVVCELSIYAVLENILSTRAT